MLSGHRDTHFRFLERLRPGDGVTLQTAEGILHRYRITRTAVVDHRTAALPAGGSGSAVVLVTCYPFGAVVPGGPLRYLVHADAEGEPARLPTAAARAE